MDEPAAALEYPCDFPIKVMGRMEPGFAQAVLDIVLQHAPDFDAASMELRPSRQARYLSVTCTIRATSREQLDSLYRALCDHPKVVMVL
ncbi:YbeD family protein [Pelomicrobium sp.]|jgi:putative lipoic acid-binding regulatory protein|uniref:YbeD family protein n=1 Tax=Pelomicrobium sp. TaxID=2815319 RepID=UPI002FDEC470